MRHGGSWQCPRLRSPASRALKCSLSRARPKCARSSQRKCTKSSKGANCQCCGSNQRDVGPAPRGGVLPGPTPPQIPAAIFQFSQHPTRATPTLEQSYCPTDTLHSYIPLHSAFRRGHAFAHLRKRNTREEQRARRAGQLSSGEFRALAPSVALSVASAPPSVASVQASGSMPGQTQQQRDELLKTLQAGTAPEEIERQRNRTVWQVSPSTGRGLEAGVRAGAITGVLCGIAAFLWHWRTTRTASALSRDYQGLTPPVSKSGKVWLVTAAALAAFFVASEQAVVGTEARHKDAQREGQGRT